MGSVGASAPDHEIDAPGLFRRHDQELGVVEGGHSPESLRPDQAEQLTEGPVNAGDPRPRRGGGRQVAGTTGPLRIGHVSWVPERLIGAVGVDLRVDEWVMPSHVQVRRVLDGVLDAAIAGCMKSGRMTPVIQAASSEARNAAA